MKSTLPTLPPPRDSAATSQPEAAGPGKAAPSVPAAAGVVAPATLDFALLRGALEEIPFGVATTRGAALLYANEALSRIFGAPGLEQRQVSDLFTPSIYADIARALEETRVFDDRVKSRGFDGRELDLEVHVEQYSSEAQGTGGFLVVRDVSAEASALGRLVEQLAGALFRVRVADAAIELVSPGIARITGIDAARCVKSPVLLTTLLSGEERERVAFLYRRMVKGDLPTANAQVSLRRPDGVTRVVQIRANARRDTGGFVRHIDGVIIDAARDPETAPAEGPHRPEPAFFERDATARATMDLTHDVLREASQQLNAVAREVRALRALIRTHARAIPADTVTEIGLRLDSLTSASGAAGALNRGARQALSRGSLGGTLGEILDAVRGTLAPTIGDGAVIIDTGDAAAFVVPDHVEGLTLAITHLALRAFRFAGSGTVRLTAHRVPSEPPALRRGPPREQVTVEILGAAPADLADSAMEISSEMLRTVSRPEEADFAHGAAQALIAVAGGAIESDDASFSTARSVVRLRG